MKHQDEYRDGEIARLLIKRLHRLSAKPVRFMEICGTHTVAIFRHGLKSVLPPTIELVSGPGCPVCVTATEEVDRGIRLARIPEVRVVTFGDLLRVPGSESSLQRELAAGARISVVYSPMDALRLAVEHPSEEIVLLGIGFETTAPTVAATVLAAARAGLTNVSLVSAHKCLPPAMETLLSSGDLHIHGLICPGHVTTIIGVSAYETISARYQTPCVVTGFEPVDILQGILMLTEMIEQNRVGVAIQYKRGASADGNPKARAIMDQVFKKVDAPWRGLGMISLSGLGLRDDYRRFDARLRFDLNVPVVGEPNGCRCGDVLRGVISPPHCPLFAKTCCPDHPVGPCMVSTEGSCAAHYHYAR
jgi:hydrogenase expression/formation protein HypD